MSQNDLVLSHSGMTSSWTRSTRLRVSPLPMSSSTTMISTGVRWKMTSYPWSLGRLALSGPRTMTHRRHLTSTTTFDPFPPRIHPHRHPLPLVSPCKSSWFRRWMARLPPWISIIWSGLCGRWARDRLRPRRPSLSWPPPTREFRLAPAGSSPR